MAGYSKSIIRISSILYMYIDLILSTYYNLICSINVAI